MSTALQRLVALLPPEKLLVRPEQLAAYESDGLTAFRQRPPNHLCGFNEDGVGRRCRPTIDCNAFHETPMPC